MTVRFRISLRDEAEDDDDVDDDELDECDATRAAVDATSARFLASQSLDWRDEIGDEAPDDCDEADEQSASTNGSPASESVSSSCCNSTTCIVLFDY